MTTLDTVDNRGGTRVLLCAADGPRLATEQDAVDLLAEAFSQQVDLVVLPVARLAERFFDLRSGFAGQVVQKFVQYRRRIAIVGDIDAHVAPATRCATTSPKRTAAGKSEFLRDIAELDARLAAR